MRERRGVYGVLVGIPAGKRPLERPRSRLEDNTELDLHGIEEAWIGLIWLRIGTGGGHL
jgi:hypothetical protein